MNSRTFLGQGWGVEGSSKAGQGLQPVGRALPGVGGESAMALPLREAKGRLGGSWREEG